MRLSEHLGADGREVLVNACRLELEGVVSKLKDGRYRSGRNDDWDKATCRHRETFAVAGWAEKQGKFDGLYLAHNEGGGLTYAGKLERGFSEEEKRDLVARLEPLREPKPPIGMPRKFPKAKWVRPAVLVDAEYRGKTGEGLLRHPSYQGVREDLMDVALRAPRRASGRRASARSAPRR